MARLGNRWIALRIAVSVFLAMVPGVACGQESGGTVTPGASAPESAPQAGNGASGTAVTLGASAPESAPQAGNGASGTAVTPGAGEPGATGSGEPRRRMRRTIENREFSDCDKIALLLNAHCDMPTLDDLQSTSPMAETCLLEILQDEGRLYSVRIRALESLALYGEKADPRLRENLVEVLSKPREYPPRVIVQAIRSYVKLDPERAPELLAPFLDFDNDMIRFVTIRSLSCCPGEGAIRVLRERYEREKNAFFKKRLGQAIQGHGAKGVCR